VNARGYTLHQKNGLRPAPTGKNTISPEPPTFNEPGNPLQGFAFAADWVRGAEGARELLPDFDEELRKAVAARQAGQWQPWSADEIAELRQFNVAGGNAAGAGLAELLAGPATLAVVTGQQPNLLASPLYILHKALAAIAWARQLQQSTGRRVVPVFWVASDDHDFEELRDCWLVQMPVTETAPGRTRTFTAGELLNVGERVSRGEGVPAGSPAYRWKIQPNHDAICLSYLRSEGHSALVEEQLVGKSETFEDLFCRTLSTLLGPENPILFVAPRLQSLRRRQRAILARELRGEIPSNALLSAAGERMEAAGYPVRLDRSQDLVNAFYLHQGVRQRIVRKNGGFELQDVVKHAPQRTCSAAELLDELERRPENFTPNVVTRPLLQDEALPSVAYLGGPGEIAYLAQLGEVYAAHGVLRAAVGLRAMLTLIHPKTAAAMKALGLEPRASVEEARARLLETNPAARELLGPVEELESQVFRGLKEMGDELTVGRPHLQPAFRKTRFTIQRSIARLRERVARQADPAAWNEVAVATALLAPRGQSQERWLSPLQFLDHRESSALADVLMQRADYTVSAPQVVEL